MQGRNLKGLDIKTLNAALKFYQKSSKKDFPAKSLEKSSVTKNVFDIKFLIKNQQI
jgi:hypothetical protein